MGRLDKKRLLPHYTLETLMLRIYVVAIPFISHSIQLRGPWRLWWISGRQKNLKRERERGREKKNPNNRNDIQLEFDGEVLSYRQDNYSIA